MQIPPPPPHPHQQPLLNAPHHLQYPHSAYLYNQMGHNEHVNNGQYFNETNKTETQHDNNTEITSNRSQAKNMRKFHQKQDPEYYFDSGKFIRFIERIERFKSYLEKKLF